MMMPQSIYENWIPVFETFELTSSSIQTTFVVKWGNYDKVAGEPFYSGTIFIEGFRVVYTLATTQDVHCHVEHDSEQRLKLYTISSADSEKDVSLPYVTLNTGEYLAFTQDDSFGTSDKFELMMKAWLQPGYMVRPILDLSDSTKEADITEAGSAMDVL